MNDIWMPVKKVVSSDAFYIYDRISGASAITALDVKIYLGNTDKTYEHMIGSDQTFSGGFYSTNLIQNLRGGNTYVLAAVVTVDGEVKTRKCEIRVQKESDGF